MISRGGALFMLFITISAIVLQATLLRAVAPFGVFPDLIVVLAVFAGARWGGFAGMIYGLLAGFMLDELSIGAFGANTIAYGLTGLLSGWVVSLIPDSLATRSLTASGGPVLLFVVNILITVKIAGNPVYDGIIPILALQILLTGITSYPLQAVLDFLAGVIEPPDKTLIA